MWKYPLSAHGFGSFGRLCLHPGLSGCPQDELCIPRRAELLEEWESLSIPCLVRAQLENLVLSLRWDNVQRKPNVGLAESWGACWGAGGSSVGARPLCLVCSQPCSSAARRIFHSQLQGMFCSMDNCSSFLLFVDPVKR